MVDRDELIQTRITSSEARALKMLASQRGISIADAVREGVGRILGGRFVRFWAVDPGLVKETTRSIKEGLAPNGALDLIEWGEQNLVARIHLNDGRAQFRLSPESISGLSTWLNGEWRAYHLYIEGNPKNALWQIANVLDVAPAPGARSAATFWLRRL